MTWSSHCRRSVAIASLGALVITIAACGRRQIVQGECRSVHGADVCVWGEKSGNTIVAFGATIPVAAIENAPAEAPMVWPPVALGTFSLPAEVSSATGFQAFDVFWEAHGHPPEPYLVPHFDFHFYAIPLGEVEAIDCADSTKPARLPTAYELPDVSIPQLGNLIGLCVPKMGMHALAGPELHAPTPFHQTMIVGYYRGHPTFVEPMVARQTLLERRSFVLDVPDVPDRPANVHFPKRFRADYDSTAQAYRLVFSDFSPAGAP